MLYLTKIIVFRNHAKTCAPQKVYPALIARLRPAVVGCFWPIFFIADHNRCGLDGDFEFWGIERWPTLARRLAEEMAMRFSGEITEFAGIPAFQVCSAKSRSSVDCAL